MQIAKYAIILSVFVGLMFGAYLKGSSDKQAQLTAKYVKDLERVQIQNTKLAEVVAQKESEITEKAFEYEQAIDGYIANIRTNTIRLRIKPKQASLPKDEPAQCGNDEASEAYVDARVFEELALCNSRRNELVFQIQKLQSYVKQNLESVNRHE